MTIETARGASLARGFSRNDPDLWPLRRSSDIFELRYGKALVESSRRPGSVPVFGTNGQTGVHDTALFSGPGVIIGRKGMGHLGVHWSDNDFWVIDTAYSLAPTPDVDLKFAFYLLSYVGLDHLKHGTSNPSLTREVFGAQYFPIPPIGVQRVIAEVLGALDDKIAANDKLALTSEELLAALFAAAGLDGEVERLGDGPPIDELLVLNPKLPPPLEDEPVYVDMQKLPTSGMSIPEWGHRPAKGGARFQNGDTLLARITPCLENGKTGYVDFLADGQVGLGSTEYIVMRSVQGRSPGVAYFLAKSPRFREFAIRHMVGSSGRQRLSSADLREYRLTQPDEVAMRRFERTADTLMPRIGAARDESRTLARCRDVLLPQLMSGKIRVRDAERVVERVV